MTRVEIQAAHNPPPSLPDYVLDPNAALNDKVDSWRYGRAPDYTKTRQVYAQTRSRNHETGSLASLVENLVKNWEVEASFKKNLDDWRTVDKSKYTFAINGGPPQSAEHMLKVGTYNAIIPANEYYSPEHSDFNSSHKTFKRMMPTFSWEVLEAYSGPPVVAFKWRHWGTMKADYVGFNESGQKVTAKAHGGPIDIQGITIAHVNDKLQIEKLETWFDPLEMFRQIAPHGVVNKELSSPRPGQDISRLHGESGNPAVGIDSKDHTAQNRHLSPGRAVLYPAASVETTITHEEMSKATPAECPFLMNKE